MCQPRSVFPFLAFWLIPWLIVGLASSPFIAVAQPQEKPAIETAADLPRTMFALEAKPSLLVLHGGEPFAALKSELRADVQGILSRYHLADAATERELRETLRTIAMLDGRWSDVLRLTQEIQAVEQKPSARATTGLLPDSYARAALAAGSDKGEVFATEFRSELARRVDALDYELAQDALQRTKAQFELLTAALLEGELTGSMDPNAEAQGLSAPRRFARQVVSARQTRAWIPLRNAVVEVIGTRIAEEAAEKVDRWTERLVSLEDRSGLTPVLIGVWDSGTDPSVFPGRMWVNAQETENGRDDDGNGFVDDVHGIAFGTEWGRATGALRPMPDEDVAQLEELLSLIKGALDLQASVSSEEAQAFREKMTSLTAEEVLPFQLQLSRLGMYLHGTATAHTSQRENPVAQLMHARFDFPITAVPVPLDEARAQAFATYVGDVIGYFKEHRVRVVNMSWRLTLPQIEATLASVEPDAEARSARATAIFETINEALVDGIASAPDILFVTGAGNEDEDIEFVQSTPAGINLPNVLTVGAVDVALQPASFTSYGASIDLYANGFEVPSVVPGGKPINISGTSLAAPQVTNLAAKLWALDPDLSVAEVRSMIVESATVEGERGLAVIHPVNALNRVARAQVD